MEMFKESESGGLGRKMRSKDRCIGSSLFLKRLPAPVKNSRKNAKKMTASAENFTKIYQFLKINICSKKMWIFTRSVLINSNRDLN